VTAEWRNELHDPLPVVVTIAPEAAHAGGVPVRCVPGLSGGTSDERAAQLTGHTVVHLHTALTPACYDGRAETSSPPASTASFITRWASARRWYRAHIVCAEAYSRRGLRRSRAA
jgi:hypothetical protein